MKENAIAINAAIKDNIDKHKHNTLAWNILDQTLMINFMSDLTYEIANHMLDIKWKIILLLVTGHYDSISLIEFTDMKEFNDCI